MKLIVEQTYKEVLDYQSFPESVIPNDVYEETKVNKG